MSFTEAGKRPRRGRPRKEGRDAETGLGSTLSARIAYETKEALIAEADRTGRSISQVSDQWLREASQARANVDALLGGQTVARILVPMITFARRVAAEIGDPAESLNAYWALRSGMTYLADKLPDPTGEKVATLRAPLRSALIMLCDAAEAWPFDADPDFVRSCADGRAFGDPSWLRRLRAELDAFMRTAEGADAQLGSAALEAWDAYKDALEEYVITALEHMLRGQERAAQICGDSPPVIDSACVLEAIRGRFGLAEQQD